MLRHFVRRLLASAATLVVITCVMYTVIRSLPGEPFAGDEDQGGAARGEAFPGSAHTGEPLPIGYAMWLADVARLDLGHSLSVQPGRPVASMLAEAIPYTLALGAFSLTLTLGLAIPLGVLSAWRPESLASRGGGWILYGLHALPAFWIALALQQLVAGTWRMLPPFGAGPLVGSEAGAPGMMERLPYWILPTLAVSLGSLAFVIRFCRAGLLEQTATEVVRAARARGAGQARVLWIHALAGCAVPLVSLLGLMLPGVVSGGVLVESIFALPGVGRLFFTAASRRDYPVVMAVSLLTGVATLGANLLADTLYGVVDPAMRRQPAAGGPPTPRDGEMA